MSCPLERLIVGQTVEFFVTLPTVPEDPQIRLRCFGRVVRFAPTLNAFATTIEGYEFISDAPAFVPADTPRAGLGFTVT
jgi:hypothetical protein